MNAIKGKPRPERISDPEQVRAWCLMMLGRDPRPGEVLELIHLRDSLWELREVKP